MAELSWLVEQSREGDLDAFSTLIRRFQDMAHGYAYSILGDFHLAEDAAQEAFIDAYRKIDALREPAAFPGWFRRIVFKHCDRIMRRRKAVTVPLDEAMHEHQPRPEPSELQEEILNAIRGLPERQREATTLHYINGYSQHEIADFLEVPVTTVRKRLQHARGKLRERMLGMVDNTLKRNRLGDAFADAVIQEINDPSSPHIEEMETLFGNVFAQDCIGDLHRDEDGNWEYRPTEGQPHFRAIIPETGRPGEPPEAQVFALVHSGKAVGVLQMFYRDWEFSTWQGSGIASLSTPSSR